MPPRRASRSAPLALSALLAAACGPASGGGGDAGGGGARDVGPTRPLEEARDGVATFYDATGAGNCSYEASPGDLRVAAMNDPEYGNSEACGNCVEVVGPRGTVTVRIVDRCPECASGHLDLSREAFADIADPAAGRVPVRWRRVSCAVTGPVAYRFKEGSSQWWVAIQVRNHRVAVRGLEARVEGAWVPLERQQYNYFIASAGLGVGPFTLRVTASDGQQIVDEGVALREAEVVPGAHQFQ